MEDSKCLRCNNLLTEDFQLIFDETGIELDLQNLLKECFQIDVEENQEDFQALCTDCSNELIEVFDYMEKEKEKELLSVPQEESENPEEDEENLDCQEVDIIVEKNHDGDDDFDFGEEVSGEIDNDDNFDVANETETEEVPSSVDEKTFEYDKSSEEDLQSMEITYLEEMEEVDMATYKLNIFNDDLKDVTYNSTISCWMCSLDLKTHSEILQHIASHEEENGNFPCIVDQNCTSSENLQTMSKHIILEHYDPNNLVVYCTCPECGKMFKNLLLLNKHACNQPRHLSRLATECEKCGRSLKSNKRYRFHQQFHLESHRPKGCLICGKSFRYEDEFYEHVMYFHDSEDTNKLVCLKCDKKFLSEKTLSAHKRTHAASKKFDCKHCNKKYAYKQLLIEHMKDKHKHVNITCEVCAKTFARKAYLAKHMHLHKIQTEATMPVCSSCGQIWYSSAGDADTHIETKHGSEENVEMLNEVITLAIACEYCEAAFNNIDNLRTHRAKHKPGDFQCNMCPMKYNEFKKLKTHKVSHKEKDTLDDFPTIRHYACDFRNCTATYALWPNLRTHKVSLHSKVNHTTCSECDLSFSSKSKLSKHVTEVHGGLDLHCHFCNMSFKTKMALAVHTGKKHQNKFKCDECGTCYGTSARLKKHQTQMHIRMSCNLCGKDVKNQKNLDLHMNMIHKNMKRYFCAHCNKGYYNKSDCQEHEQAVHAKQKRFKCDECDYETYYSGPFKMHKLHHDKSNVRYHCEICSKPFLRKATYDLHMKRHFLQKEFICPVDDCEKSYPSQNVLNRHIKLKHSEYMNANRTMKHRRLAAEESSVFIDDDDGLEADDPTEVVIATEEEIIEEFFYSDDENIEVMYVNDESPENVEEEKTPCT